MVVIMREPDIEAIISTVRTEEGGRIYPFFNGYRPDHLVMEDYLTTGVHNYYDKEFIPIGESALGTITFITPEEYPNCLWDGKVIIIQEGSKVVGYATVTKIFNEMLRTNE